jgi:hypothetical protein
MLCRSSLVPVGWYLPLLHQSEASDIFWVRRHGIHCVHLLALKATPLDTQETHTSQGLDSDQCSGVLAFLWCQIEVHPSLGKPKGICDHQLQTQWNDIICQHSFYVEIELSIDLHGSASHFLLLLSWCQGQKMTLSPNSDQLKGVR